MKKRFLFIVIILTIFSLSFAEVPEGQIYNINEIANEEIIIVNNSGLNDAFKIWIHTNNKDIYNINSFSVNIDSIEEGWIFLARSENIDNQRKWKSSSDYEYIRYADKICIQSRSNRKYNYRFGTKHDKLYIYVEPYSQKKQSNNW